jgi:hypothetical protein
LRAGEDKENVAIMDRFNGFKTSYAIVARDTPERIKLNREEALKRRKASEDRKAAEARREHKIASGQDVAFRAPARADVLRESIIETRGQKRRREDEDQEETPDDLPSENPKPRRRLAIKGGLSLQNVVNQLRATSVQGARLVRADLDAINRLEGIPVELQGAHNATDDVASMFPVVFYVAAVEPEPFLVMDTLYPDL